MKEAYKRFKWESKNDSKMTGIPLVFKENCVSQDFDSNEIRRYITYWRKIVS